MGCEEGRDDGWKKVIEDGEDDKYGREHLFMLDRVSGRSDEDLQIEEYD